MRRRWVVAPAVLLAACSSSRPTVVRPSALQQRLVGASDVRLPGYRVDTPAAEAGPHTTTVLRYFTGPDVQLTVTLTGTPSADAARATSSAALGTVATSLRSTTVSGGVGLGTDGRELAGRTKGYGALQDTVGYVEGRVAVLVTVSSTGPSLPAGVAVAVARAQDARLRAG